MSKQDRQGIRTFNELAQRYNFTKSFAEVMGVATDARNSVDELAAIMDAELSLKMSYDDDGAIISLINASADVIRLFGDRVTISSTYFELQENGTLYAKMGVFDYCTIKNTCTIQGKLTGDTLSSYEATNGSYGEIRFVEDNTTGEAYYLFSLKDEHQIEAGIKLGTNDSANFNTFPDILIYSMNANLRIGDGVFLGGNVYGEGGMITLSDQNAKNTIQDIPEAYSTIFDALRPVTYKYNHGTNGRLHSGFIAQEVAEAVASAGLTLSDFAAVCVSHQGTEKESWGVRYEELVALCVLEIQKLKARVCELERS